MWIIKYFVRKKSKAKVKCLLPKVHQTTVINKPGLNVTGAKGYGCTIEVVMLRCCRNATSSAKRQVSILTFKSKLSWRERISLIY